MDLSSLQLKAFFETARLGSFSKAAEALHITQSALSQRVSNFEKDLEITLIIRDPSGPVLTEAGELLFRYCQQNAALEKEVLGQLVLGKDQLAGVIRIAGFSSVLRSVIIPSLAQFLRSHTHVQCEFQSCEVKDLAEVLRTARAELVVMDYRLCKSGVVEVVLGQEEYVVIESAKLANCKDVYLDHGPHDNATESFFKFQSQKPMAFRRTFMGDVYGILNGVEMGLGKAVMSKHLLKGNNKIKIKKSHRRYFRDVTLHYYEQPYYSKLQLAIVQELKLNTPKFL